MTTGDRIKKIRKAKGLTRAELAYLCSMSELTIRSYEQNVRKPSNSQIEKIALALGVNVCAISDPDLSNRVGLAHTLFEVEELYGLTVAKVDGLICIKSSSDKNSQSNNDFLSVWYSMKEKLINGDITQEEYNFWKYNYPVSQTQIMHNELKELREKNKKDDNN